jgi:hypothetical protein
MNKIIVVITCRRLVTLNRQSRRPLQDKTDYRCTGPDGTAFQNYNRAELLSLLRRRYGDISPVFVHKGEGEKENG